jgi:hypothetical protein
VSISSDTCFSNVDQELPVRNFIKRHPAVIINDPLFPLVSKMTNATNTTEVAAPWLVNQHPAVYAGVEMTEETSVLSDHYPVFAAWKAAAPVLVY